MFESVCRDVCVGGDGNRFLESELSLLDVKGTLCDRFDAGVQFKELTMNRFERVAAFVYVSSARQNLD